MSVITVFGASGRVGGMVVAEALSRGHLVTGFVHRHPLAISHPNLRLVSGRLDRHDDLRAALQGSGAVISALSSWKSPGHDVLSKAIAGLMPVMEELGLRRLVSVTGSAAWGPSDTPSPFGRLEHLALSTLAGSVVRDAEKHILLLSRSKLDWTVVRSPVMTGSGSITYCLTEDLIPSYLWISRKAVAAAVIDLIENESHPQKVMSIRG